MNSLFALRLKSLRIEANLTLQQVADYLSVNKTTISYYEKGKRVPSFNNLVKLSELFGVSLDYLLGNSSQIKESPQEYVTKDLVTKSLARSKILRDFLLEDLDNIIELENYIKKLKS